MTRQHFVPVSSLGQISCRHSASQGSQLVQGPSIDCLQLALGVLGSQGIKKFNDLIGRTDLLRPKGYLKELWPKWGEQAVEARHTTFGSKREQMEWARAAEAPPHPRVPNTYCAWFPAVSFTCVCCGSRHGGRPSLLLVLSGLWSRTTGALEVLESRELDTSSQT